MPRGLRRPTACLLIALTASAAAASDASALSGDSALADDLTSARMSLAPMSPSLIEDWTLVLRPFIRSTSRNLRLRGDLSASGRRARACATSALGGIVRAHVRRPVDARRALRKGRRALDACAVVSPVPDLPDGRLAFWAGSWGRTRIYTSDQDGGGGELVRLPQPRPASRPGRFSFVQDPDWSPDGTALGFVHHAFLPGTPTPSTELVVADGVGSRTLGPAASKFGTSVSWSPDGRALMVVESPGVVVIVSADGSARSPMGTGALPDWSPTGDRIAVVPRLRSPAAIVELISLPSGRRARLPAPEVPWKGEIITVDWSPDGLRLVLSDKSGVVYVVSADGTGSRVVTSQGWDPRWLSDGRILFREYDDHDLVVMDADGGGRRPVLRAWRARMAVAGFAFVGVPRVGPS